MGRNIGYSVFTQDDYWWEPARELYGKPDLTLFSNLEELSLENLYEELPWWRSQIVQILKNSPGLNDLRLSLSSETMAHYFQDDEDEMYRGFFDRLCDEYHETGAPPLRLQSLYLGAGTAPLNTASLQKLTDPSFLENLHIENTDHWSQGEVLTYNDGTTPIAWASFGPTHCPNLRSLTAGNYLPDIHVFLASVDNPSFLRRLALFTVKCEAETATLLRPLTRYPALPMRPRMVEVDLDRGAPSPVEGESEDALEDELVVPSAELVLEHLVSGDDGALEGLILGIPVVVHGEVNLSFVNLSLAAVAKLVNLTQLAVYVSRPDPVALSELEEVARRFAAAAPSLRYVAVLAGSLAYAYWRVWRSSDGTVELGVLEGREVRDVELFRFMMWEQSDYVRCEVNHRYLPYRRMSWLMSRPRHSMHR